MKIAILTSRDRVERFSDAAQIRADYELVYLGQQYTEDEALEKAGDAEVIVVDAVLPVTARMIRGMPKLRLIHSEGVSYNRIDLDAAAAAGVTVCNNRAVNAGQVAEHTVMLAIAVLRRVPEGDAEVRKGNQKLVQTRFVAEGLRDLSECRVGMVGFGAIGRELAKRLKPFGCRLSYFDPLRADEKTETELGVIYADRDTLLRTSDIITLHVPVNPGTVNFICRETLAMMKKDAIIINCARGAVVNSADLAEAIMSGKIFGAGLDTMEPEPVPVTDPVLCMPEPYRSRVILTPHVAGMTRGVFFASYRNIWENIAAIADGRAPKNVVKK